MKNFDELMQRVLDPADFDQYVEAQEFLREVPPSQSDPMRNAYGSRNLLLQNWANALKCRILYELIELRSFLLSKEANWRSDLRDEGIRSAGEREAGLHGVPQYRALKQEVDEYQLVADRLSALEWILKSAIK